MRHTRSQTRQRRSHHALVAARLARCANCGAWRRRHRACTDCGFYRGRQVLTVKAKAEKKSRPGK